MDELSNIEKFIEWLATSGVSIVFIIGGVVVLRRFSSLFMSRIIRNSMHSDHFATEKDEKQRSDTLVGIANAILKIVLFLLAGILILDKLGINIAPIMAGAGVVGLAIGFGAQSLVSDFVAGMFIIMENQYRVGDYIEIDGYTGKVELVTLRTTIIRDWDGNKHHIPNGQIKHTINKSMEYSNVKMSIGVGYDTDIDKVEKIINDIGDKLATDSSVADLIIEPPKFMRVSEFSDSSVVLLVKGKVKAGTQWDVAGEIRKEIKVQFDKHKIEIPFPQRVIHTAKKT